MKRIVPLVGALLVAACAGAVSLRYYPYELKLRHAFNLASMSRRSTPGVQVEITVDSVTGYGEASMPPYLGESVESVTGFLSRIDPERLSDPLSPWRGYMSTWTRWRRAIARPRRPWTSRCMT